MNIFERWKKTTIANKALALSSVLMAFGTLFYAGAALVQIFIMKRSATETSKQVSQLITAANIQAGAAEKNAAAAASMVVYAGKQADYAKSIADQTLAQAKATNNLAKTSEETLVRTEKSLRPWVNAQKITPNADITEGWNHFSVEVDNGGNSPALHTVTYMEDGKFCGGDKHDRFPNNPPYHLNRSYPSTAMLMPNTGGDVDGYSFHIDHDEWTSLNMGTCSHYVYGIITYCDIFGRLHWQNYCGQYISGTPRRFDTCYNYSDGDQDFPNSLLSEASCPKTPNDIPPEWLKFPRQTGKK